MIRRVATYTLTILALTILIANCAPKHLSPEGQRAYTADQVVVRLGELQSLTIDLHGKGRVSTADSRAIVSWISGDRNATPPLTGAVDVLQQAAVGWQAIVRSGWLVVKPRVLGNADLASWAAIIDALLEGL